MSGELERLRARLVTERELCDAIVDASEIPSRTIGFAGRARGLSLAIEHIDIILREKGRHEG